MKRPVTRMTATAAAGTLLLLGAACGGEQPGTTQQPVGATSTSATPSPTPVETPSPTPTTRPLSRFEDEPPVIAARKWAAAMARGVNARDRSFKAAAPFMTKAGRERFSSYAQEDFGLRYPGPMPFTPTAVTVNGRSAEVSVCWWAYGFALDPKTKRPADKRKIEPATLFMKKEVGRWKLDDQLLAQGNCGNVTVKGLGW